MRTEDLPYRVHSKLLWFLFDTLLTAWTQLKVLKKSHFYWSILSRCEDRSDLISLEEVYFQGELFYLLLFRNFVCILFTTEWSVLVMYAEDEGFHFDTVQWDITVSIAFSLGLYSVLSINLVEWFYSRSVRIQALLCNFTLQLQYIHTLKFNLFWPSPNK